MKQVEEYLVRDEISLYYSRGFLYTLTKKEYDDYTIRVEQNTQTKFYSIKGFYKKFPIYQDTMKNWVLSIKGIKYKIVYTNIYYNFLEPL